MRYLLFVFIAVSLLSCQKSELKVNGSKDFRQLVEEKLKAYSPVKVDADLSTFSERDKTLLNLLAEAGKIAEDIFWQQSANDAIAVRDSLTKINIPVDDDVREYLRINFGPYDVIYRNERFIPGEPKVRFAGAGFYPQDMTKEEFETFVQVNPDLQDQMESSYTVIVRKEGKLIPVSYHEYYPQMEELAKKLEEASEFADEPTLKRYLLLRAKAFRTDDYFESDMAWMDVKGNIDIVIGPIETYQDALFGYKASFEAVVMVKDSAATAEFEMFKSLVEYFEKNLPQNPEYTRKKFSSDTQLNLMNVVYFGGDCQKGTKTIAASLPNDPRVRDAKGGKNSMYKNMMEAKFEKILIPIASLVLESDQAKLVDKKAFTSFVTMHEFSHTLGRGFVFGNDKLEIRNALKERYSAIEECKADILSMWNHKMLLQNGNFDEEYITKAQTTYLPGLFRSIRFGTESAHAKANLIQLNFLLEKGAIEILKNGKYRINKEKFWAGVEALANEVLTIEATGDYARAGEFLAKYSVETKAIKKMIEKLKDLPRDIDSSYLF
jgi:hypothetical protein